MFAGDEASPNWSEELSCNFCILVFGMYQIQSSVIYLSLFFIYMIMIHVILTIYQVGLGSFLLRYIPGLLRSVLTEIGVSEDMYNPVSDLELF